jgi:hypothetical protein
LRFSLIQHTVQNLTPPNYHISGPLMHQVDTDLHRWRNQTCPA